jgi:hypothetical protein
MVDKKKYLDFNKLKYILCVFSIYPIIFHSQNNAYYDKYEYRKKRHEINFGVGASSCLTDLGGSDLSLIEINQKKSTKYLKSLYDIDLAKTRYTVTAAYLYHLTRKLNFRTNFSFASISADDAQTNEFYRNNRNLNFTSNIIEISGIIEFYISKPSTGNRYGLKNAAGKNLASNNFFGHLGLYLFAGIGGFYFDPIAENNLDYSNNSFQNQTFNPSSQSEKIKLRELHTEGQGLPGDPAGFESGQTYSSFSVCFPFGFGVEKAFSSSSGIKLEGGFRYTTTDYLDDVSRSYYNRDEIGEQYGELAATMSGTHSGSSFIAAGYAYNGDYPDGAIIYPTVMGTQAYKIHSSYTEPNSQRGNPDDNDCYAFVTLSFYKKIKSKTKAYKKIKMQQKRKVKASF